MAAALSARETRVGYTNALGDAHLRGELLGLGPILEYIDNFSGTVAENAIAKTVAVACVDQTEIVSPIFHGDAVRFEGEVINTGSSSLTVQMTGYRHDISTRQFVHAVNAVITLVALDEHLRPSRGLPPLVDPESPERVARLKTLAKQRKELSARWQSAQEAVDLLPRVTMGMLDSVTTGLETSVAVPVKDTLVAMNTSFMPRYLNRHGTVFGGDILLWMDKTALYCAKVFTGNSNMHTVAVERVSFKLPIKTDDMVAMEARVGGVRDHFVDVEVEVFLRRFGSKERRKSHTAYFTVASLDASNHEKQVAQKLTAMEDDQESMRFLLKAQHRRLLRAEEREQLHLEPLTRSPVSGRQN